MKRITCAHIDRMYKNEGSHAEQMLAYTLTGEMRTHDSVPFDKGSDIPEFGGISVKSSHATIVSGALMHSDDKIGQITEYFDRVASTQFAYVSKNEIAYIMDAVEFHSFLVEFVSMERESEKNGGKMKMRLRAESKGMIEWLNTKCA